MRCLQLPFRFDVNRLRADLAQVASEEWIPHMQRRHYDGEWSGAALRSPGGASGDIVADAHSRGEFRGTALLARCPYFQEVLATFRCPLLAVRLLRLHAGSNIAEHVDRALDFDDGEVRIHIPIITTDDVKFFLDGSRLVMAPGESWYTNVNLPHSVENRGTVDRIHLVLDCVVDDWLRGVFATTARPACDHYAARLELPEAPPLAAMTGLFAESAPAPVKFHIEGSSFILSWKGRHTWQFRLRQPESAPSGPSRWVALLESSPDPERLHQRDYEALLARIAQTFPGIGIACEGLAA